MTGLLLCLSFEVIYVRCAVATRCALVLVTHDTRTNTTKNNEVYLVNLVTHVMHIVYTINTCYEMSRTNTTIFTRQDNNLYSQINHKLRWYREVTPTNTTQESMSYCCLRSNITLVFMMVICSITL